MGLAAGQARLLTITARKSDCEYQSMRLSHQKIALSRQLADLSNEYQNSLDQTKLIYDYYGTGDESTPLSYGLCMTPSALNEYMPILLTDQLGRVTLNSKYAAAARAAGIPQEGLGTLPSQKMRNAFIQALAGEGLITDQLASTIQLTEYNQGAGFGDNVNVYETTIQTNYEGLLNYLTNNITEKYTLTTDISNITSLPSDDGHPTVEYRDKNNNVISGTKIHITDLLKSENDYTLIVNTHDADHSYTDESREALNYVKTFLTTIRDTLKQVLCPAESGSLAEQAFAEADADIEAMFNTDPSLGFYMDWEKGEKRTGNDKTIATCVNQDQNYLGVVGHYTKKGKRLNSTIGINLNNFVQAYLTLFVDKMNGVDKQVNGQDQFYVNRGAIGNSKFVSSENDYEFTIYTGMEIEDSDLQLAAFYDTIFNQICASGWTENNNIEDNEYLQNMLQSGMLFISKVKDDGYYYQGNYATDSYIKEITDDSAIAEAEAKYNTEKAKLNSKEETLDLKMKNLDTEISSLTTEYDTVKNTISKNIEKSFKRYNA